VDHTQQRNNPAKQFPEMDREFRDNPPAADVPKMLLCHLQNLKPPSHAHSIVDELETTDGMAVHAYLHRKEGADWNANYWYARAGRKFHRPRLEAEWQALVEGLLAE